MKGEPAADTERRRWGGFQTRVGGSRSGVSLVAIWALPPDACAPPARHFPAGDKRLLRHVDLERRRLHGRFA